MTFDQHTELQLLEALENEPETTQADLAAKAGVAVGTVNWYIKRWSKKGMVIVKRMDRWRWHYLLTPKGISEKANLASKYVEASMHIYRRTRNEARLLLTQVQQAGHDEVVLVGNGDLVDICRLTCLEMGIHSIIEKEETGPNSDTRPVLNVNGTDISLSWPSDSKIKSIDTDTHFADKAGGD